MPDVLTERPNFKTTLRHRRLGSYLNGERRGDGYREAPVMVRLEPASVIEPSEKPPVRIYVGTESAQFRAERVFLWSIHQVRDPTRSYEIYLMKDLAGFDRRRWKTGFTNYRYAVPSLAGARGRAIYNDVDQIYLADPAELFDTEMKGAGLLSIDDRETSVMLLDCEKLAPIWPLEDVKHLTGHKFYRAKVHDAGCWGHMSPAWNARDSEYIPGKSKLLHFTTLHKQPWQPFPDALKYEPNVLHHVWQEFEDGADSEGFTIFRADSPSLRYKELLDLNMTMHLDGDPQAGLEPERAFAGISLVEHVDPIAKLVRQHPTRTILDFGSGKGSLYEDAPNYPQGSRYKRRREWGGAVVTCYDPCYQPFSDPIEDRYDGVICTDVLEHIPEEDIGWFVDDLFNHARHFVYVVAACFPAKKHLPDGTNAHCTVQPPSWWRGQMELAARRHPDVQWILCTQEKTPFAFTQRKSLVKRGIRSRFFPSEAFAN